MDSVIYTSYLLSVDQGQCPVRIDKYLASHLKHVSRNRVQQSIAHKLVKVNGASIKASYKVRGEDQLELLLPSLPEDQEIVAEPIPLSVVHEDEEILIVDKPAGQVVHPAHQNWQGTLLNGLLYYFKQKEGYPFLVHRLDKDTSGLLVVAKNEEALCGLSKQFLTHTIRREYRALVWGRPQPSSGTICAPLQRHPKDRRMVCVSHEPNKGRHATTHYETIASYTYVSLLSCRLETGRTHQIRAHMRHIGHPVFNDTVYDGVRIHRGHMTTKYKQFIHNCWQIMPRQALHALRLQLIHPKTQQLLRIESALPKDFSHILEKWKKFTLS